MQYPLCVLATLLAAGFIADAAAQQHQVQPIYPDIARTMVDAFDRGREMRMREDAHQQEMQRRQAESDLLNYQLQAQQWHAEQAAALETQTNGMRSDLQLAWVNIGYTDTMATALANSWHPSLDYDAVKESIQGLSSDARSAAIHQAVTDRRYLLANQLLLAVVNDIVDAFGTSLNNLGEAQH